MSVTTLYRPVGQPELDLIVAADWRCFPPRLDWQPIFYPVLSEAYATRIARDWNTKDAENGNVGYVLRFEVDTSYLERFDVQQVGDAECLEYWIPAEELEAFNDHIVDKIELVSVFGGTGQSTKEYIGHIWVGDDPGVRLAVQAPSAAEARALVEAEYGEGHTISLRNEGDASRPR